MAEERSTTLEQRPKLDAKTIAQLHKERDKLCQTAERLRSKHDAACGERDQGVRERDEAQQRISSL